MKIAVFGATGGTGRLVLDQGIHRGYLMTAACTRHPQSLTDVHGLQAIVQGDGRDPARVQEAAQGQDVIISILSSPGLGPGTTVSEVTQNIIAAMQEAGARRLICVSAHPLIATRPWLAVKLVKLIFRNPYADLAIMEQAVKSSGLEWTIVRPTRLTNGAATGHARRVQGDFTSGPNSISRADLATVLLDVAANVEALQQAIEVSGATPR
ncbi:MAG: NAD(P)H-binding protein [Ktedonobacterales bacterium]